MPVYIIYTREMIAFRPTNAPHPTPLYFNSAHVFHAQNILAFGKLHSLQGFYALNAILIMVRKICQA